MPDGVFALECPACPHPGRNLPNNWEDASDGKKCAFLYVRNYCWIKSLFRWLYSLFLALDANFRLKLKDRKINDPELGSGWAYFVQNQHYIEHVSQATDETEVI
jgi:hypothetical protein